MQCVCGQTVCDVDTEHVCGETERGEDNDEGKVVELINQISHHVVDLNRRLDLLQQQLLARGTRDMPPMTLSLTQPTKPDPDPEPGD